jgi:hypothetical protein
MVNVTLAFDSSTWTLVRILPRISKGHKAEADFASDYKSTNTLWSDFLQLPIGILKLEIRRSDPL